MPLNTSSIHSLSPYHRSDTTLGIVKGRMNKKTPCPSCVLQRKAATETELLRSVINAKIEISTQFGAGTKEEKLNLAGEIHM